VFVGIRSGLRSFADLGSRTWTLTLRPNRAGAEHDRSPTPAPRTRRGGVTLNRSEPTAPSMTVSRNTHESGRDPWGAS